MEKVIKSFGRILEVPYCTYNRGFPPHNNENNHQSELYVFDDVEYYLKQNRYNI